MKQNAVSAKKSLGQNFLVDNNIIGKIIAAIAPQQGEHIIEVGPGQGALTGHLLPSGAHIHALEKDERMAEPLGQLAEAFPETLHIHFADALETTLTDLAPAPFKLVGNLPYNVGTQIVLNAVQNPGAVSRMVFMLQKEVVERITAKPNTKDWGRLGVWCDLYCTRKKLFDVPPTAFHPRPKVTSAIVELTPRDKKCYDVSDKKLGHILRLVFTQRRKMIRASLKGTFTSDELEALGLNPQARPETLSTEDFCTLANAL